MCGASYAYEDGREPRGYGAEGLGEKDTYREYGENEHRLHPCRVWVELAASAHRLVDEDGREFASDNGEHRDGIKHEDEQLCRGAVG